MAAHATMEQQRNGVFCAVRTEMIQAGQLVRSDFIQSVSEVEWSQPE
jgi:hypothetical protein